MTLETIRISLMALVVLYAFFLFDKASSCVEELYEARKEAKSLSLLARLFPPQLLLGLFASLVFASVLQDPSFALQACVYVIAFSIGVIELEGRVFAW